MKILEELPETKTLGFGLHFAPWMSTAHFQKGEWSSIKVEAATDLSIHPASKALHYGQEIFEGLKTYRQVNGKVALFRPRDNIKRMALSAEILSMPEMNESAFLESLKDLVKKSLKFIPNEPGSLYLRPTMIGVSPTLGVAPATEYLFFNLASPVAGYFGEAKVESPQAISVWVSPSHVRAVRGGLGSAKTGANYAASLRAVTDSKKLGFNNVMFLDALEHRYLEELSGMNVFIVEEGTLKTPQLGDTILAGVTRDTLLKLAQKKRIPTFEGPIDIEKVVQNCENGKVSEIFACGTGAAITAISALGWKNRRIQVGKIPNVAGPLTTELYKDLTDTQYGRLEPLNPEWIVEC